MNGDDHRLIERCLSNDRGAQHELYQLYAPRMYSLCLRYCRSPELAQDALQEGFVRVFRNLGQFKYECPLEFWIRRIVINASLRVISNENRLISKHNVIYTNYTSNYDGLNENISLNDIQKAIDRLPTGYRTIFHLFAIDGFSHKEIAEMLYISEGTSKSQYARARKRLQEDLKNIYPEFSAES